MADTTSNQIITAAADDALLRRLVAIAARHGVANPHQCVEYRLQELVSCPVTAADDTIASVYAYTCATYVPAPTPGENLAAVTDSYLLEALTRVGLVAAPVE